MEATEKQQKANEFLASIYAKAWEDEDFKRDLVNNPITALNKFTGRVANFPEDKKLEVSDQTNPDHIYLNIPVKPDVENIELTESQL
jgi:hypothetical protein